MYWRYGQGRDHTVNVRAMDCIFILPGEINTVVTERDFHPQGPEYAPNCLKTLQEMSWACDVVMLLILINVSSNQGIHRALLRFLDQTMLSSTVDLIIFAFLHFCEFQIFWLVMKFRIREFSFVLSTVITITIFAKFTKNKILRILPDLQYLIVQK